MFSSPSTRWTWWSTSEQAFDQIVNDYTAFAMRLEIPDLRFIPVSALTGDNIVNASTHMQWYRGETLLYFLENVHIASDRNLIDLRFPVQYVSRPNATFRGFAGTVASGIVRAGDEIMVLPSGVRTRVKSIVTYDGDIQEAYPPMAVTLTLQDEVDVSRGDTLVHTGNLPRVDQTFEAMLVWMAEDAMEPGKPYLFKHATSTLTGQVAALRYRVDVNTLHREDATGLAMNEVGRVTVRLTRPICFDPYARNRLTGAFIVIDRRNNRTVGAGMIIDRATSLGFLQDHWDTDDHTASSTMRQGAVGIDERTARQGHNAATLLLTGLAGAGKTTIALALERRLFDAGCAVAVLDGSQMRQTINRDLGFSAPERSENLRRSIDIARLFNDVGLICVCAFMAPNASVREKARQSLGESRYLEIFVTAPLDVCRQRDRTGLYEKADAGEIDEFPGVSAPFEAPVNPDLVVDSDTLSVEQSVERIVALLKARGVVPALV